MTARINVINNEPVRIDLPEKEIVREAKRLAIGVCVLWVTSVLPVKAFNKNLLLYLSFDSGDAKVAQDLTGKTKGGVIKGGAKIVNGIRGKALELDGESGYLEIELTPDMIEAERNSFTAELWLKTKAKGPEIAVDQPVKRLRGYLVFGGYGPDEHFHGHWSMFLQNGDNLSFYTININSHTSGGAQGVVADNTFHLNDGEWHHIAAVRDEDAKEIRLFINGRLVGAEGERNRSLNKADGGRKHTWIGIHIPNHAEQTGTGFFPATVDEVRFWNIAMTQADAARYMTLAVNPLQKLSLTWGEIKAKRVEGD